MIRFTLQVVWKKQQRKKSSPSFIPQSCSVLMFDDSRQKTVSTWKYELWNTKNISIKTTEALCSSTHPDLREFKSVPAQQVETRAMNTHTAPLFYNLKTTKHTYDESSEHMLLIILVKWFISLKQCCSEHCAFIRHFYTVYHVLLWQPSSG